MGCARLDAVTYPDPAIAEYLAANFICVRVNTSEQPKLTREYSVAWTPALLALHPRNIRLREVVGYLPPAELLPELKLMKAQYELRSGRPDQAEAVLQALTADHAQAKVVPEALYWQGCAAFFRTGGQKEPLFAIWRRLIAAYPDSIWAQKTTLSDWPDSPYLLHQE